VKFLGDIALIYQFGDDKRRPTVRDYAASKRRRKKKEKHQHLPIMAVVS